MLRRRFWLVIVCVMIMAPIGIAVAYMIPPVYKATATVLVRDAVIPSGLAGTTVNASPLERLNEINTRLLSRDNLLKLVEDLELAGDTPQTSAAAMIGQLRRNIVVQPAFIGPSRSQKLNKFSVSYSDEGPGRAARVANALVDIMVAWNIEDRQEIAATTKEFFEDDLRELTELIALKEEEINVFQANNACCLPSTLQQRQGQLANLESQSIQREQQIFSLQEQRRFLQEQIDNGTFATQAQKTPAERQLETLELQRTTLLATFSEQSTRVRALDAQIEQLRKALAPTGTGATLSSAELQARQRLEAFDSQIRLIEESEVLAAGRKKELQDSIGNTVAVDGELKRMGRELASLQTQYGEAQRDFNKAKEGFELEASRQGERFEIADYAQTPFYPDSLNRRVVAAGGVFAGVLLGALLMALFEFLDKSIRTAHAMEHRVGLRPVVSIPYVVTTRERVAKRLRWAAFFLTLLIVIPAGLYAVDRFVMPLEVLLTQIGEKAGISAAVMNILAMLGP